MVLSLTHLLLAGQIY